jgi:hypothetical protein
MKRTLLNQLSLFCILSSGAFTIPSTAVAVGLLDSFERLRVVNISAGPLQEADISLGRMRFVGTKTGQFSLSTAFTGATNNGISRKSFSGSMGPDYRFSVRINSRLRVKFEFRQDPEGNSNRLNLYATALREDGTTIGEFILDSPFVRLDQVGTYTLASSVSADRNAGSGWAVFNVSQKGYVTIAGRTSYSVPFSAGGYLQYGGTFNFFSGSQYKLIEPKFFTVVGEIVSGQLNLSPTASNDGQGFIDTSYGKITDSTRGQKIDVVVSRYTAPSKGSPWITGTGLGGTVNVVASGGWLNRLIESTTVLGNLDRAEAVAPLVSLQFQRETTTDNASGTLRGKYILPGRAEPRRFRGVVFQKTNEAVGFFEEFRAPRLTITPKP